jgi:hypothetical protein
VFCWQFKEVIFSSYEPGYAMMKGTIVSAIPGCSEGQVRRDSRESLVGVLSRSFAVGSQVRKGE